MNKIKNHFTSRNRIATFSTFIVVAILIGLLTFIFEIPFGCGCNGTVTPTGAYIDVEGTSSTEGYIIFGAFSENIQPIDLKLIFVANGTHIGLLSFSNNTGPEMNWESPNSSFPPISGTYVSSNLPDEIINPEDYVLLTGLLPGTKYELEILHIPTDSIVSMTGDSAEFRTLP